MCNTLGWERNTGPGQGGPPDHAYNRAPFPAPCRALPRPVIDPTEPPVPGSPPAPPLPPELTGLLAERARTFDFAARLLPAHTRQDVRVLYALFRHLDDLADEPGAPDRATVAVRYGSWRRWLLDGGALPAGDEALALAYADLARRYAMPPAYLLGMLDGLESDLGPVRIQDFAALQLYCLRVAGTVGLAMCHILGVTTATAFAAAADLGIAMQLTNVLRDIGGDLDRDRVYLPADELQRFGYSAERLFQEHGDRTPPTPEFRALMAFQVERARAYYQRGLAGVWLLPDGVRPSILVAGRLYRAILEVAESRHWDVLHRRAYTSRFRKGREAVRALAINWLWGKDRAGEALQVLDAVPAGDPVAMLGLAGSGWGSLEQVPRT